jgi:hypothetical protein
MWQVKKFKTVELGNSWLLRMEGKIEWFEIYVNNIAFAIQYRKLRVIM